jgi:hypothetical protein
LCLALNKSFLTRISMLEFGVYMIYRAVLMPERMKRVKEHVEEAVGKSALA